MGIVVANKPEAKTSTPAKAVSGASNASAPKQLVPAIASNSDKSKAIAKYGFAETQDDANEFSIIWLQLAQILDEAASSDASDSSTDTDTESSQEDVTSDMDNDALIKHQRLGHVPSMAAQGCESCIAAASTRRAITKQTAVSKVAARTLDRMHCDLMGPMTYAVDGSSQVIQSLGGNIYAMVTVDEHSRFAFVHTLASKGDATESIIHLLNQLRTQYQSPLKSFTLTMAKNF